MKINEFQLDEIERLSKSGFEGGKEYLDVAYGREKTVRKLPGSSGLLYSVSNEGGGDFDIKIWDKQNKGEYQSSPEPTKMSWHSEREHRERLRYWQERNARRKAEYDRAPGKLIAKLSLGAAGRSFPLKGALQVGTITVDEDYRGAGLAKALYGIVLTIMKRPLLAGDSQTPGGRRNWVSLSQIPGVEMKGYVGIDSSDLNPSDAYSPAYNKKIEQNIDTIMGQLGGQYIGKGGYDQEFFAFDVQPSATGKELEGYVKTKLSKVYDGSYDFTSGLYAIWTGQP